MEKTIVDIYNGWNIKVSVEESQCSCANYSFTIVSPEGREQFVKMGGENETRALERAKEMIDAEIAYENGE